MASTAELFFRDGGYHALNKRVQHIAKNRPKQSIAVVLLRTHSNTNQGSTCGKIRPVRRNRSSGALEDTTAHHFTQIKHVTSPKSNTAARIQSPKSQPKIKNKKPQCSPRHTAQSELNTQHSSENPTEDICGGALEDTTHVTSPTQHGSTYMFETNRRIFAAPLYIQRAHTVHQPSTRQKVQKPTE